MSDNNINDPGPGDDTRLGRKVEIEVLSAEFACNPERLARFEYEVPAASTLDDPHIAVVHIIGSWFRHRERRRGF